MRGTFLELDMSDQLTEQIDNLCDEINEGLFGSGMPTRPSNTQSSKMHGQTGDRLTQALKYQDQVAKVIKKRNKKKDKKAKRHNWLFQSEDLLRLMDDIDMLLEATKKAHSWPKGGGKICDKGLASAKKKYKGKWSAYAAGYATQVCKGKKK
jgi:hypothetical protein